MERVIKAFQAHLDRHVETAIDQVLAAGISVYAGLPRDVLRGLVGRSFKTVIEDLEAGTTTAYPAHLEQIGASRAKSGMPIREMITGVDFGFKVVDDHFDQLFAADLEARLWWATRRHELSYAGVLAVTNTFYQTREAIIAEQSLQIIMLSAPILPLAEGILVLPIIGSLSDDRAAHLIENLLDGITRNHSRVVILDVTGMLAVDESATRTLLRAARAAQLLGAKIILVGIRPEVAMAFTSMGADLGDIAVKANLTHGFELAQAILRTKTSGR